jgi:hypothetical protein
MYNPYNIYINVGLGTLEKLGGGFNKNIYLFIGTHQDINSRIANIFFPSLTIFEKKAVYLNYFEELRSCVKIVNKALLAKSESDILYMVYRMLLMKLFSKQNIYKKRI